MSDDYQATTATTGSVAVGGSATGEIETAGDRDWFAVTLKAGRWYRFDVEGHDAGSGALANPAQIALRTQGGELVTAETTFLPGHCFQPSADVAYFVEVGGQADDTGGYRLSIVEVPDDFAAGTDTTGTIAVGGEAAGTIEHGSDRDWFAVTLEAGKTYRIDLKGSETGDGTLADPNIGGVFDADGRLIDRSWDDDGSGGKNSRALFTAARDGVHYIEADVETDWEAADRTPWIGTYKLSVVEAPPDLAADASTTGVVAVGSETVGELERSGDRDWIAVTLAAGKAYIVELKGKDTGDGTLRNPYLDGVFDAGGNRVGSIWNDVNDGDGRNSRSSVFVKTDGTYYVGVEAFGRGTGTYTLSVAEDPDLAANTNTTGAVAVGGEVTGEIERVHDSDWFAVTLEAGKTYIVDLKGKDTGDGTLKDPGYTTHRAGTSPAPSTTTTSMDATAARSSLPRRTARTTWRRAPPAVRRARTRCRRPKPRRHQH